MLALLASDHPRPAERSLQERIYALQDETVVLPLLALQDHIEQDKITVFKVPSHRNILMHSPS